MRLNCRHGLSYDLLCEALEQLASSPVLGFFRLRQQIGNEGNALDKRLPWRNALNMRSAHDINRDNEASGIIEDSEVNLRLVFLFCDFLSAAYFPSLNLFFGREFPL